MASREQQHRLHLRKRPPPRGSSGHGPPGQGSQHPTLSPAHPVARDGAGKEVGKEQLGWTHNGVGEEDMAARPRGSLPGAQTLIYHNDVVNNSDHNIGRCQAPCHRKVAHTDTEGSGPSSTIYTQPLRTLTTSPHGLLQGLHSATEGMVSTQAGITLPLLLWTPLNPTGLQRN